MKINFICTTAALGIGLCSAHSPFISRDTWAVGQTVNTTSGSVTGRGGSYANRVSTYLGIPFAKPPVGDLRFAPPQRYKGPGAINGTAFAFSCPINNIFGTPAELNATNSSLTPAGRIILSSWQQPNDVFSEDCLTLNVWTKPQVGDEKKAVLVWIYGGAFQSGSSNDPFYDGQNIADEENVIVVSFNYRTNIFGFPGNPNEPDNLGLLDQRLAIEWVHDNIAAFGGDPSRITLFGQSSGSQAIDFYSYAYPHNPIASGLILQSGTTALGVNTKQQAAESWYNVTAALGCGDANSTNNLILSCMRSKSWASIIAAIPQSSSATGSAAFLPTIDDTTVFSDYPARSAAGNFSKIPLLIGNNDYEAGFQKTLASLSGLSLPDAQWDAFNNLTFACPAAARANISGLADIPTWRYRYFGQFSDLRLTVEPDSRAYHTSEIPMIFNTLTSGDGIPAAPRSQLSLAKYLRGAWAAFAQDPVNGLKGYADGWPEYDPKNKTLIRLGYNNIIGASLEQPSSYDSTCT